MAEPEPFEVWLSELERVGAAEFGFTFKAEATAWKLYYDEGYTPFDAMAEDMSNG